MAGRPLGTLDAATPRSRSSSAAPTSSFSQIKRMGTLRSSVVGMHARKPHGAVPAPIHESKEEASRRSRRAKCSEAVEESQYGEAV